MLRSELEGTGGTGVDEFWILGKCARFGEFCGVGEVVCTW